MLSVGTVSGSWNTDCMTNTTALVSTWTTRELPILRAALERLDVGAHFVSLEEIRAAAGLDVAQMRAGLNALEQASPPYVSVSYTMGGGTTHIPGHLDSVSERARRELGTWPSAETVVDRLAKALADAADQEQEPARKGKLRVAAEALVSFGRVISVDVLAKQITG